MARNSNGPAPVAPNHPTILRIQHPGDNVWVVELEHYGDINVDRATLASYKRFRIACMEKLTVLFWPMGQMQWSARVDAAFAPLRKERRP
jgi:hypothetical protein